MLIAGAIPDMVVGAAGTRPRAALAAVHVLNGSGCGVRLGIYHHSERAVGQTRMYFESINLEKRSLRCSSLARLLHPLRDATLLGRTDYHRFFTTLRNPVTPSLFINPRTDSK